MRIAKDLCQRLSTGLIAAVVSGVTFVGFSTIYEAFDLQRRLRLDDDICLIALLVGPALIPVIHRVFHRSHRLPVATLAVGSALGSFGVWQIVRARDAAARHVPCRPLFRERARLFHASEWICVAACRHGGIGGALGNDGTAPQVGQAFLPSAFSATCSDSPFSALY